MRDLQDIVPELTGRGALKATEQPIDTGTAAGKVSLDMLGFLLCSKPTCDVNAAPRGSQR